MAILFQCLEAICTQDTLHWDKRLVGVVKELQVNALQITDRILFANNHVIMVAST